VQDDEVTFFTVREAWQAAPLAPFEEWCVDFNTIRSDLDFRFTKRVFVDNAAIQRFSLQANGPSNNALLNKIDASPFVTNAPDNDISGGSTYARMFVDGDSRTNTMVTMDFEGFASTRIVAWGGMFKGTQTNEKLQIEVPANGFFGFTLKTEELKLLRFKGFIPDGDSGGETFGLDNVCARSRTSSAPSRKPSSKPSRKPSSKPSSKPSRMPSSKPSRKPSSKPSTKPSRKPSRKPTPRPTPRVP
jgi:cell division septation protein DedD